MRFLLDFCRNPCYVYPMRSEIDKIIIENYLLAAIARDAGYHKHPRKKNWSGTKPVDKLVNSGDILEINGGMYKARNGHRFTAWSYKPVYSSWIERRGDKLVYFHGLNRLESKTIKMPAGMRLEEDGLGVFFVRESDGMDYHFTGQDFLRKDFVSWIRQEMANKYKRKVENNRNARRDAKWNKFFQRDLGNTMVNIWDSRRAGNCLEGSLSFAERRLKLDRREIMKGGFLVHVSAKRLVNTGDPRAIKAARAAWERETTVCI